MKPYRLVEEIFGPYSKPFTVLADGTELVLNTEVPDSMFSSYGQDLHNLYGFTMLEAYELLREARTQVDDALAALIQTHEDELADYVYDLAHAINREIASFRPTH